MAMLFLADREAETIEILRMYQPAEGYYLAFSGGKDSVVLYEMAKRAGVKFDAHYHITTADPPELVRPCLLAGSPIRGVALDPFFGSGTVGLVAKEESRGYIGIDLNPDYCEIARERIARAKPRRNE